MLGSFRRRNCTCGKRRCTCGAKWYYRYDIINPKTGKRKQKEAGGFETKAEAEIAAKQILSELQQGTYIEEKDIAFGDFAKEWLIGYQNTGKVKISTVRIRQHEINRLNKHLECLKMKDITLKNYQDALYELHEELAFNTLDGVHRTGRMIFKRAVELEIIKKDPTQYAILPKTQKTVEELELEKEVPKYLEKEDLSKFLQTAKEHGRTGDYPVFLTLAYSGMRAGELCPLKDTDIVNDDTCISITKTYYNPDNNILKYHLLPPKTKRSKRVIEMDPLIIKELKDLIAKQEIDKQHYGEDYHNKGFIFTVDKYPGYPIYIKLIEGRMRRLLKLAGLNENLTPHSLRHTHTSLLAEAGVSLEQIMDRLGHEDDETTKAIYLHITKPKKKEASQKFSELLRGI